MARVTREHLLEAHQRGWSTAKVAEICGVTKQAVIQMRKKYFPDGMPQTEGKKDQDN